MRLVRLSPFCVQADGTINGAQAVEDEANADVADAGIDAAFNTVRAVVGSFCGFVLQHLCSNHLLKPRAGADMPA